jgi:hypothetical protein
MDEVNRAVKTTLWIVWPIVQENTFCCNSWMHLLIQSGMLCWLPSLRYLMSMLHKNLLWASILARKWKDKVEKYDSFRQQALQIVPELGPSFEGDHNKEEKVDSG